MKRIQLTFGSLGGDPPDRFLVFRDGKLGIEGLDELELDAESASKIIAEFEEHGSELVIDYHHASRHVEEGKAAKAPAAGWIRRLTYIAGEGLYAESVEWTKGAKEEIAAGEFQYLSPTFFHDKTRVVELHSIALTNRPRTINAWKLIAAQRVGGKARMAEDIPEFPAVSPEQMLLAEIIDAMGLDSESSMQTVLESVLESLKMKKDDVKSPEGEEKEVAAAKEAEAQKLAEAERQSKETELASLRIKAAGYDALAERVQALETERSEGRVSALIAAEVERGTLNPNDAELVETATKLAANDEAAFKTLFASMKPVCASGSVVRETAGRRQSNGSQKPRAELIACAAAEFRSHGLEKRITDVEGWVNGTLIEAGQKRMTKDEAASVGN